MKRFVNILALSVALATFSVSCAGSRGSGSSFNVYSAEQDVELGRQSAAQI